MRNRRSARQLPAKRQGRPIGARAAFTLLETLLAVTIFSVAIVGLIEAIASNTRMQALLESQSRAVALAQNIMEEIEYVSNLQTGSDGGDFEGDDSGFSWASETADTEILNLCEVRVTVSWKQGDAQRDYQLATYLRKTDSETSVGLGTETYGSSSNSTSYLPSY